MTSDASRQTLDLIHAAQAGEPSARNALAERFLPFALYVVRSKIGRPLRKRMESMDLVQEAMAGAFRSLSDVDPFPEVTDFESWLAKVIHNRVRHEGRRQNQQLRDVRREVAFTDAQGSGAAPAFDPEDLGGVPLDDVAFHEWERILQESLDVLPEIDQRILRLRYYEAQGASWEEIGERVGKSAAAARMANTHALVRLLAHVEARGAAP